MNNEQPRYNDLLSEYTAIQPKKMRGTNNLSYNFYYESLLHVCYSLFTFENLPDNWDRDYLLNELLLNGVVCVTDTELGVLPLRTSFTGYNVYRKPTKCIISNEVLGTMDRTIGNDCVLLNIGWEFDHFVNLRTLITFYSTKLAECDASITTNLMNSKVAMLFIGNDNAEIQSMKKAYDEFSKGSPSVFIKSKSTINKPDVFFNNVRNTYIVDSLQDSKDDIYNEFLSYVGIKTANTDKKERMNIDEVNVNNEQALSHVESWYYNLNREIDKVNEMFGLDIRVSINYDKKTDDEQVEQEESEDEPNQSDGTVSQ